MKTAILCSWLFINLTAFLLYGIDKRRAIRDKYRISEKALLLFAALGGSIGALWGMHVFHHKTHRPKFRFGVPLLLLAQIALVVLFLYKTNSL